VINRLVAAYYIVYVEPAVSYSYVDGEGEEWVAWDPEEDTTNPAYGQFIVRFYQKGISLPILVSRAPLEWDGKSAWQVACFHGVGLDTIKELSLYNEALDPSICTQVIDQSVVDSADESDDTDDSDDTDVVDDDLTEN